MSTIIIEHNDSRKQTVSPDSPSAELHYVVRGTEDEAQVKALVSATRPLTYDGLSWQDYTIDHLGNGIWDVVASYGKREPKEAGDQSFSFDTTGGTQKITQSLNSTYYASIDLPEEINHKGAINVRGDQVEGIDIIVPKFSFSVERIFSHPLDGNYIQALYEKTGKVNTDTVVISVQGVVFTFNPGELLYEGATGSQRGSDDWQITLKCAASQNVTLDFGPDFQPVEKRGWDYLWCDYETVEGNSQKLTQNVVQVNIEQVHDEDTLAELFA